MLSLSQTAGYAILALGCLDPKCKEWVLAKKIAAKTGISRPYLSKILHRLGQAGLIRGKRGYRGGLILARPPDRISVLEISAALDGNDWKDRCLLGLPHCGDDNPCPLHDYWMRERPKLEKRLSSLTLDQVARYQDRGWHLA
jgi:Rrf2 family protein